MSDDIVARLRAELAATREERDRARAQMEPDENKFLALYAEQDALRAVVEAAFQMQISNHPEWEKMARAVLDKIKGGGDE